MSAKPTPQTESAAMITRLLSASDKAAQQQLVTSNSLLEWPLIISDLTDQVRKEVHVSTASAHRLADLAMTVADVIQDQTAMARSRRAKANTLYATDEHAAAVEMHESAVALFEAAGETE